MKKAIKTLSVVVLLLTTCFGFTSCEDPDDWDEEVLVGKWWSVDDSYDVICIDFYSNHRGLCTEDSYYNGFTRDDFTWFVDDQIIHIVFSDGSSWLWDYDLYNGHTVRINGRIFSRDRYYNGYYSNSYFAERGIKKDSIQ